MRQKRKKVFDAKSLILVICCALIGGLIVVNSSGFQIETVENGNNNSEYLYQNYQDVNNGDLQKLKICLAIDGSGSGWQAVVKENLIENLGDSLHKFSDEGHIVEFDSFSRDDGDRSSNVFLEIESDSKADIWDAIKNFKSSYNKPYGDIAYSQYVEKGIERLNRKDDKDYKKILVALVRSPDAVWGVTDEECEEVRNLLETNNVTLYVIGLSYYAPGYDLFKKYTSPDKVFENVPVEAAGDYLTKILEIESFANLLRSDVNSPINVSFNSEPNKCVVSGDITVYTTSSCKGTLTRVFHDDENNEYEKIISEKEVNSGQTVFSFDDIKFDDGEIIYKLKISGYQDNMQLYYKEKITRADIVKTEVARARKSTLFEFISQKIGFRSDIFIYLVEVAMICLIVVRSISRLLKYLKADKYAMTGELKG